MTNNIIATQEAVDWLVSLRTDKLEPLTQNAMDALKAELVEITYPYCLDVFGPIKPSQIEKEVESIRTKALNLANALKELSQATKVFLSVEVVRKGGIADLSVHEQGLSLLSGAAQELSTYDWPERNAKKYGRNQLLAKLAKFYADVTGRSPTRGHSTHYPDLKSDFMAFVERLAPLFSPPLDATANAIDTWLRDNQAALGE